MLRHCSWKFKKRWQKAQHDTDTVNAKPDRSSLFLAHCTEADKIKNPAETAALRPSHIGTLMAVHPLNGATLHSSRQLPGLRLTNLSPCLRMPQKRSITWVSLFTATSSHTGACECTTWCSEVWPLWTCHWPWPAFFVHDMIMKNAWNLELVFVCLDVRSWPPAFSCAEFAPLLSWCKCDPLEFSTR